jgi:hypothetical protein
MRRRIDCHYCRYYYVTWEKSFPHGCRGMKFKSRRLPCVEVFRNSGRECLMFRAKERPPRG